METKPPAAVTCRLPDKYASRYLAARSIMMTWCGSKIGPRLKTKRPVNPILPISLSFLRPLARCSIPSPIPRGSMAWVRVCRASLALLPQLPRQNKSSTGADVHREPAQASPVLSPGFDSSIGHPLQLVEPFSKIRRLQCLDIGFYQLAKLASLSRGEIADRNCLQECRCCVGCVRSA